MRSKITKFIALISGLGIIDTAYLSWQHFNYNPLQCSFFSGCDIVTTSRFAVIGGIPLALIGLLFYAIVFILNLISEKHRSAQKILLILATIGFGVSVVLLYLQIFVIKALCIYCLTSFATSTLIFIALLSSLRKNKNPIASTR